MKKHNGGVDKGKRGQLLFAESASVERVAQAGFDYKPIGDINTAKNVGPGCPVMIYNSGNAVAYVAFGATETVSAPADAATGIPILAGEKFMVNSGESLWIIGSANTVYAYVCDNPIPYKS